MRDVGTRTYVRGRQNRNKLTPASPSCRWTRETTAGVGIGALPSVRRGGRALASARRPPRRGPGACAVPPASVPAPETPSQRAPIRERSIQGVHVGVLEFAAGTGRVTLPLAANGLDVSAIELSEPMAARLRAKPGGDRVDLTIGDMATTRVLGEFGLVYLVYNTISNLLTQDEQVACFANAAAHLAPGGCFVIEDAAQSFGATYQGKQSCIVSTIAANCHAGWCELRSAHR